MITSRSPSSSQQDVPPVLALLGFGLVVGALFYLESPTTFQQLARRLDSFFETQTTLVCSAIFTSAINGTWIYSILSRALGFQKQGSRLELMTGRRSGAHGVPWRTIGVAASLAALSFCTLALEKYPSREALSLIKLPTKIEELTLLVLRLNFSFGAFVAMMMLSRAGFWKAAARFGSRTLPKIPAPENSLVLGSVAEDQSDKTPEWAVSNRRGLNGNILITGSIGSGKTQGTILPYLDQILGNFRPRPSILAIDPKGTFIPVALKIIEKHGLSKHVLHMRLGGDVTFNPVFHAEPLKGARFLETAQMIRAAAVNFMGKSFDSPFWEISAFNLIKNCLVLCGAKYREV